MKKKRFRTHTGNITLRLLLLLCVLLLLLTRTLFNYSSIHSQYIQDTLPDFLTVVGVIIAIIWLIVHRKIRYLNYLAKRVKKIARNNLGATVEIRGNDELAELAASINYMSQELRIRLDREKAIESAKDELITNVSHDLRSPLTSIIGYVDLLRRKEYSTEEQMNDYVNTIYHKSLSLQALIQELFDYTKLSTPGIKINRAKVNLGSLLEQLVGEYTPVIHKEEMTVTLKIPEEDLYVEGDADQIVRAFENILTNAIKYSVKPSELQVKLERQGDLTEIVFSNEADPKTVGRLDQLFEKFYRADSARKDTGGAGLGLAIAKRIVELHRGRIRADYVGRRIRFAVELPVVE
ncbi:HAMP domain-containing sensor histidine kinase [Gorillibacterium massiliense]|uniref:HAMP domain-containing sensor histidine kinase n=1 Tax=Gorillibacterium massiliense TaxID=1280390 RepID=UPI0004B6E74C|nr:HAMP domain-containing sensor histidine kinase [Gorillibacterium massiliense]